MGLLSLTLTDLGWNLLPVDGPILSSLDGEIVLTSLDDFPASKITISPDDERALRAVDPPVGIIVEQEGVGEICRGKLYKPSEQIVKDGDTLTLELLNSTEELREQATGPGWVAATGIDTIAARLASKVPGWSASVIDTGAPVVSTAPVRWINFDATRADADLNALTKKDATITAPAWDTGATGDTPLLSNGALSTVAFGNTTYRMFGFIRTLTSFGFGDLTHGVYLQPGTAANGFKDAHAYVFEGGASVADIGVYSGGDVFTIAVAGTSVTYLVNNVVKYRSAVAAALPLYPFCTLYTPSSAILGATLTSYVAPADVYYATRFENVTVLDAEMDLAKKTYRHIRQRQDANGVPIRALEIGLFGAGPNLELSLDDAVQPADVRSRAPYKRLIKEIDYTPDASEIVTIGVLVGGGTGDNQVRPEDIWAMIYDINSPLYGAYRIPSRIGGTFFVNANFPEYDEESFPIERRVALDGNYYYVIKSQTGIDYLKSRGHATGEIWGDLSDSSLVYVDKSPDTQKWTVQRALYEQGVARLRRHNQVHYTFTVTCEGRDRIVPAGDLVHVTGRRPNGAGFGGPWGTGDLDVSPTLMSATRRFTGTAIEDVFVLSTLATTIGDDVSAITDTMKQVELLKLVPTTGQFGLLIGPTATEPINSAFPFTTGVRIPNNAMSVDEAQLRITLHPARHTVKFTTIADGAHSHTVSIPPLSVSVFTLPDHVHNAPVPGHDHGGINTTLGTSGSTDLAHGQGTSDPAARNGGSISPATVDDITSAIRSHQHTITVTAGGDIVNAGHTGILYTTAGGFVQGVNQGATITTAAPGFWNATGNHNHGETIAVKGGGTVRDLGTTNRSLGSGATPIGFNTTTYGAPIVGTNATQGNVQFAGITTATNATTAVQGSGPTSGGAHTHALGPDISETNLPLTVQLWIDSGDGQFVDRSPDLGGPWTKDADVDPTNLAKFVSSPGKWVQFRVVSVGGASNPTGLGGVQISGLIVVNTAVVSKSVYAS